MARGNQKENRLMSVEKAAGYLGVNGITVRRIIARGTIFPVKMPEVRRVLFDQQDLDRLIQEAKDPKCGEGGAS